ncbi:hypothetical protein [Sphingomonas jaspsi]|uniref:hypothetical protein n=1 Tax=Sphingomonas jaspsi TaxID=392409 RepID=UPI00056457C8|nr:hypothetical protein [Sphingomonas jaspsi]
MNGDWTEDARLLLARAKLHLAELHRIIGDTDHELFSIDETKNENGTYTYAVVVNSGRLKMAKPVAADVANNLVHTLDQAVGALARLRGHDRNRDIYFPWSLDDANFRASLNRLEPFIGTEAVDHVLEARERNRTRLPHAQMVKEVSNSGKHWSLIPSNATVRAVAVNRPGQGQKIWDVRDDDLEDGHYPFLNSDVPMTGVPFQLLVGIRFSGVDPLVAASPDMIFDQTLHFVEDMVVTLCGPDVGQDELGL